MLLKCIEVCDVTGNVTSTISSLISQCKYARHITVILQFSPLNFDTKSVGMCFEDSDGSGASAF
jgi:hypothetical protein